MRYIIGEIALYATICAIGVAGLFVWRTHPAVAVSVVVALAAFVGWGGYRIERALRPEGSRSRRVLAVALAVGGAGLAAFVLWVSLCSCT